MAKYDWVVLLKTSAEPEKVLTQVKKVIEKAGGEVLQAVAWGRKKLTFPIKKEVEADFAHLLVEGKPAQVQKVKSQLRINEEVLREMVTVREK